MEPKFFATQSDLRKWFMKNHDKETELFLGYYKVGSGKPSVTWPQSVDEALCFGWIDGVRRSKDEESYFIRFTKRKPTSIWSAVNIAKVEKLTKEGLMMPEGLAAFAKRKEERSGIYSFEKEAVPLSSAFEKQFKAHKAAWVFFSAQAPSYKKTAVHWVMAAKQEKTRTSRLEKLMHASAGGKRIAW